MKHITIDKADLIYHSDFGHGDLDYLHYFHRVDQAKEAKNKQAYEYYTQLIKGKNPKGEDLEERYYKCLCGVTAELLDYFKQEAKQFVPEAVITPPSNNKYLQKPYLGIFQKQEEFISMSDLSECFEKNPGGEGVEKLRIRKDKTGILRDKLNSIERILIIDDVYAEGKTVGSIIFNLEQAKKSKSFRIICVCPLYVEQSENKAIEQCLNQRLKEEGLDII